MDAIAQAHQASQREMWSGVMDRIGKEMAERAAHPARTVVLVPFAQLLAVARQAWAQHSPNGFSPRFETTRSWAQSTAFEPGEVDFAFDMGRDLLTAHSLLTRAGLGSRADALAPRLVEVSAQLAPLAAAAGPSHRASWADGARFAVAEGMDAQALQLEAAVARIAVEWLAVSSFESDALLESANLASIDLLIVLEGLQPDPLQRALAAAAGGKAVTLQLAAQMERGAIALHSASDSADEAQRAAACVLRHVEAGRTPVALAATDRVTTRRVSALLQQAGVPLRDEQGWKLSTTRSAAQVMALLRSCEWDAPTDQVLDWLKHAPAAASACVMGLERRVRRLALREWRSLAPADCGDSQAMRDLLVRANGWRDRLAQPRPLDEWLAALGDVLGETGQLARLQADDAGAQVLDTLRIADSQSDLHGLPVMRRRFTLGDFRAWAGEVLEAGSYRPPAVQGAPVVILPFTQALARPFAAIVLPGCDELRLPAAPEPPGPWLASQRRALGLATREDVQAAQNSAWTQALQIPFVDILWRAGDEKGEPLLPSPLVQSLMQAGLVPGADQREERTVKPAPVARPGAEGATLPVEKISSSAYEDLRRCPYRFFALRQLGLKEAEELDSEVDKRDFGNWVHSVLGRFHESLRDAPAEGDARKALLDRAAEDALAAMRLEEGEFLPFRAGWPALRDAYLDWLRQHEAKGARFEHAESNRDMKLGTVTLIGRIDRIDRTGEGRLVIDYKTEREKATEDRMKEPLEDTQLAFYAALLGGDDVAASYLNVGERGTIKEVRHPQVIESRDLLVRAIEGELGRIAAGEKLPALGEGKACDFCGARGLCRKDWWA